jgi:hypothetical protein
VLLHISCHFVTYILIIQFHTCNQTKHHFYSDFFPLTLTAEKGIELAKQPGFKTWAAHVPTLIHSDKRGWNKLASLMIDSITEDVGLEKVTDMFVLKLLHDYLSDEEMGVTLWRNNYSYGFPYVATDDEDGPQIDCELASSKLGAHLSHYAVETVAEEKKNYPMIEGMKEGENVQRRGEAAMIMLKDYREKCIGQNEKIEEDVSVA